jgi:hypothetical protein
MTNFAFIPKINLKEKKNETRKWWLAGHPEWWLWLILQFRLGI